MKHTEDFKNLLKNTVNLDQTRLDSLDSSVEAVFRVLKADPGIGGRVTDKVPQGSWAHETIIKPADGNEYDADFLLRMNEEPDWHDTPKKYLDRVEEVLAGHGTYDKMPIEQKCRCVRLTYAGDFHLDIVPFVRLSDGTEWIVNGDDNDWEPTNPTGYTDWMHKRDKTAKRNLRKVVRLLKYLRDHRGWYPDTRSIILTTLAGDQVTDTKTIVYPAYYADVPTALLHIVNDLDTWLQARPTRPHIEDPSAPGASFDHRWTDATYTALRDDVHALAGLIDAAYNDGGTASSKELWRDLFGTGFPAASGGSGAGAAGGAAAVGAFGAVPLVTGRPGRAG